MSSFIAIDSEDSRTARRERQEQELRDNLAQAYWQVPFGIPTEVEMDELARLDDLKRHKGSPHEL